MKRSQIDPVFRGLLFSPESGALLKFMLNPQPVSINKSITWDIEEIPGLPAPIYTFQSGGQKIINFQLFFDASAGAVSSGLYPLQKPQGLMGVESLIDLFLYPTSSSLLNRQSKGKFSPPPILYLSMGIRFWKGYLLSAPIEETRFDRVTLAPLQFTSQIEFGVVEDGRINDLNTQSRELLAREESATTVFDYSIDLFN